MHFALPHQSSELYATVDLLKSDFADTVFKFLVTWAEDPDVVNSASDITTSTRLITNDPGARIRKRVFKAYNKFATPFLHRTLEMPKPNTAEGSFLETKANSTEGVTEIECTGPICPVTITVSLQNDCDLR